MPRGGGKFGLGRSKLLAYPPGVPWGPQPTGVNRWWTTSNKALLFRKDSTPFVRGRCKFYIDFLFDMKHNPFLYRHIYLVTPSTAGLSFWFLVVDPPNNTSRFVRSLKNCFTSDELRLLCVPHVGKSRDVQILLHKITLMSHGLVFMDTVCSWRFEVVFGGISILRPLD